MIFQCDRCPTWRIAHGHPPAGWVVMGDTTVCEECHRRAVKGAKG